jgi:hypothetical protein
MEFFADGFGSSAQEAVGGPPTAATAPAALPIWLDPRERIGKFSEDEHQSHGFQFQLSISSFSPAAGPRTSRPRSNHSCARDEVGYIEPALIAERCLCSFGSSDCSVKSLLPGPFCRDVLRPLRPSPQSGSTSTQMDADYRFQPSRFLLFVWATFGFQFRDGAPKTTTKSGIFWARTV